MAGAALAGRVRAALLARMRHPGGGGLPVTYQALAAELGLQPPGTIRQLAGALEKMIAEDAAAGRPLSAALVVSRATGLPRPGFFDAARACGRLPADPALQANAWVAEAQAALDSLAGTTG